MLTSIKKSNTVQAIWIGLGSLATFTFSIVSAAILSRILSKTEYGTYKQVMYVYNTLLVVFTLGLPKAYSYFLPKYDIEYGNSIANKINNIFFIIGLLFSALLYFGAPYIAMALNNQQLIKPLKLFAISPTFILPTMGIEGIMASYKKSDINAVYLFVTRFILLIFVVGGVVLYKTDCNAAVLGFSIASIINCFIGLYLKSIPFKGVKSKSTELTYKEIFEFSLPLMFAGIGGIAIKSADQFFVSRYCGTETFADFANGSIDLPFVGMVLGAAATVLLPEFSRRLTKDDNYSEIVDVWRTTAFKSALLLYPLIVYCLFFSPQIMVLLYGDQYYASYVYFAIIMIVDLFVIAPYYPIIIAMGATGYYAKIHIIMSFVVWLLEYCTIILLKSALAIAITSAILHIVMILIMTRFISLKLGVSIVKLFPLRQLLSILLNNILSGALVFYLVKFCLSDSSILLQTSLSFVVYCICTLIIGKIMGINYLIAIEPVYRLIKR